MTKPAHPTSRTPEERAAFYAEIGWPWKETPPRKPRANRVPPPRPELPVDFYAPDKPRLR